MTEREALKLALEHIEGNYTVSDKEAITAIKEVLAQPEQEPDDLTAAYMSGVYDGKKLRTWVGLTKEECFELCVKHKDEPFSLLAAVQDKLKEKNA